RQRQVRLDRPATVETSARRRAQSVSHAHRRPADGQTFLDLDRYLALRRHDDRQRLLLVHCRDRGSEPHSAERQPGARPRSDGVDLAVLVEPGVQQRRATELVVLEEFGQSLLLLDRWLVVDADRRPVAYGRATTPIVVKS